MANKALPTKFEWMDSMQSPKAWVEARQHYGVLEQSGKGSNQIILSWAKQTGCSGWYTSDDIPWCGLFVAVVMLRSGWGMVRDFLGARNWINFGGIVLNGMERWFDIAIFSRPGGNHVGFLVGQNKDNYLVYGGNQSDAVGFAWIAKSRCIGIRRPKYLTYLPPLLRVLKFDGTLSDNEA